MDIPLTENRIHTAIFDMDGTLSDSAILTIAALKNIVPDRGFPLPSADAVRMTTGHPNPEFYYILFSDFPRDVVYAMSQLVEEEEQRLLPSISSGLLFEGCAELLKSLKESGLRLYIASTGDEPHVFSILRATGIIDFFDIISCGRPDKTEMLRELTEGRDKNGYIMVGDMKKDYDAARANGIFSVGACYGYCRREFSDFDSYIDTPLELLRLINNPVVEAGIKPVSRINNPALSGQGIKPLNTDKKGEKIAVYNDL